MSKLGSLTAAAVFGMMVAIASCADAAEHRIALVVGNSNYQTAELVLPNPRNDAEDVAAVLSDLGFEVITAINATKPAMDMKLEEFARKAKEADTALFFYAGHAMQFQRRDYLMPTDAELKDEFSVQYRMVALDYVQTALERANGVKIMILDACRNNPLTDRFMQKTFGSSRSASQTRGLARVDKTQGMLIAYATAPDDTAQDGNGRNSPFTTALLKRLREPGRSIVNMFTLVTDDVQAQTGGKQHPVFESQLSSEFVLNQSDRFVWDTIDKDNVNAMHDFYEKFPSSPLAIIARNRYELLKQHEDERKEFARQAADAQRIAQEAARRADEERNQAEADRQRIAQETAQRRAEEERKQAEAEHRRDEQLAAQRRLEEEQKRVAEQNEQKRLDNEQTRTVELNQQAEKKRLAELDQQAQQKRLDEVQKRLADGWRAEQEATQRRVEEERKQAEADSQRADLEAAQQRAEDEKTRLAALSPPLQIPRQEPKQPTVETPNTPTTSEVNTLGQIKKAQQELRRLACFVGLADGKLDRKTEQAVKDYWKKTRQDIVEIKITDGFIAELGQHDEEVCKPGRTNEAPAVTSRPSKSIKQATHDSPAPRVTREPATLSARPAPPRPVEDQRAKATASGGGLVLGVGH